MNRQRKILITVIYNDLGIIVDTKAEELDLSANLQQTCNQLATDCISRQAAIDAVVSAMIDGADAELVEGIMELLPSAQPETMRCKDCEYYKIYTLYGQTQGFCNRLGLQAMEIDDFCSRAERRSDDGM